MNVLKGWSREKIAEITQRLPILESCSHPKVDGAKEQMVSSRIHDFSVAEAAGIPTALLLLLDHLSESQEAELPPTHGCLSLMLPLLLPEPEPESRNPVLLMLQEHPSFHYYGNSTP